VLGAAWLTDWAGLSMALGAFLGGLLLADSRYRHQIMADIQPFRGLLLGLFFMSVGMSINFGLLGQQGLLVLGLVGGLLLLKVSFVWGLCRITGRSHSESVHVALLLAQAGEFAFILFGLANMLGLMDGELYQLLLLTVALSMVATPLLVMLSPWLGRTLVSAPPDVTPPSKSIPVSRNHVIVGGFGRYGSQLTRQLAKAGVPYLVLEVNPARVARAQALNYPVFYGDASSVEVLRSAGAANALLLVFVMDHMESIGQAVVTAREAFPNLPVYTRAWDTRMAQRLVSLGATYASPETVGTGIQFTRDVLVASGISSHVVTQLVDEDRGGESVKIAVHPTADKSTGYSNILLVLTPGIDEPGILGYAVALAEDNHSALIVVEVLTEAPTAVEVGVSSPDELEEQMTENRRGRLESLVADLHAGFDIQTDVLIGRPHEEIAREVVANGRDLVLKAREGDDGLKDRVFGDNDSRLLSVCPCPVLLVKSLPPKPYRHRRICAGIYQDEHPGGHWDDRYAINHRILENAVWMATAQFAELHIVHAWEAYGEQYLRRGRSPLQFDADDYVKSELKRNRQALDTCLADLRESVENELLPAFNPVCHLVKGSHRDEIVRLALNMEADLIVVGDLSHTGLTGLIIDSTAEAIRRHVNCSVLVVNQPEYVTPVVVEAALGPDATIKTG